MSTTIVQYAQTVFEGVTVDSNGNIYKLGRKLILSPNLIDNYLRVQISINGKRERVLAHRLILSSF